MDAIVSQLSNYQSYRYVLCSNLDDLDVNQLHICCHSKASLPAKFLSKSAGAELHLLYVPAALLSSAE